MSTPLPLPSPPFHTVPNLDNLRDPTLLPLTTPSGPLRPNLLFRSADVSKLVTADWSRLHKLGITHVFDLRSAPEVGSPEAKAEWACAMEAAGVKRTWTPVFAQQDYSPEGLARRYAKYMEHHVRGFVSAYRDILHSGGPAYARILRHLIDRPGEGILVHCTAGKDRTGVFFAVLFALLGVQRDAIAEEYHLTDMGLARVRDSVVARLLLSPAFRGYIQSQAAGRELSADEVGKLIAEDGVEECEDPEALRKGREAALRMVGAKKETMLATLDMLDQDFGGAEKYVREKCGLGDEDLAALKRNLIVSEGV